MVDDFNAAAIVMINPLTPGDEVRKTVCSWTYGKPIHSNRMNIPIYDETLSSCQNAVIVEVVLRQKLKRGYLSFKIHKIFYSLTFSGVKEEGFR